MDKLSKQQQEAVRKMSTERLRVNLMRLEYSEDTVLAMDRDALVNAWAELVLTGQDKPQGAVGGTARAATTGYNVELEREKLAFEKLSMRRLRHGK